MMSVCISVCLYVCGLITQKRLNRLGSNSQRVFSLVPGWFQAKKSGSGYRFAGKSEKTGFQWFFINGVSRFFETIEVLYASGEVRQYTIIPASFCSINCFLETTEQIELELLDIFYVFGRGFKVLSSISSTVSKLQYF